MPSIDSHNPPFMFHLCFHLCNYDVSNPSFLRARYFLTLLKPSNQTSAVLRGGGEISRIEFCGECAVWRLGGLAFEETFKTGLGEL
jgi:hypothetical protein